MKFKKDGKVYDTPKDMVTKGGCIEYAQAFPTEAARLLGFEVLEDNSPTIAEIVEKYGEDVKPDPVNRPSHYTSGGIECIDAMQAAFGDKVVKDFCLCNAFKYLWRHQQKNGVEDLKKARWYLNRLIREMEVEE